MFTNKIQDRGIKEEGERGDKNRKEKWKDSPTIKWEKSGWDSTMFDNSVKSSLCFYAIQIIWNGIFLQAQQYEYRAYYNFVFYECH